MAERIRVVLDVNVVLDVLQRRQPFIADSSRLMAEVEAGRLEGLLAAHCVRMTAARRTRADYLVTRDRACYSAGPVPALSPAELLALLEA